MHQDYRNSLGWRHVERATSELLIRPDWEAIRRVCDFVSSQHTLEEVENVAQSIRDRLSNNNPQVVLLALHLFESCINNCSFTFHAATGQPLFMNVVEDLAVNRKAQTSADWAKVQEKALTLIQYCGQKFLNDRGTLPAFYETYARLTAQGCIFPLPKEESSQNLAEPMEQPLHTNGPSPVALGKLSEDLDKLQGEIKKAKTLESWCKNEDDYLDLLDFLEQCQPRMVRLVEVGVQGILEDALLARCLELNDSLCQVLESIEMPDISDSSLLLFGEVAEEPNLFDSTRTPTPVFETSLMQGMYEEQVSVQQAPVSSTTTNTGDEFDIFLNGPKEGNNQSMGDRNDSFGASLSSSSSIQEGNEDAVPKKAEAQPPSSSKPAFIPLLKPPPKAK